MAPESERAKICERCGGTPFPSTVSTSMMQFPELYGFCQCLPNFTQATAPNEPTLTCSEVVERLAAEAVFGTKDLFDRVQAGKILAEWLEDELDRKAVDISFWWVEAFEKAGGKVSGFEVTNPRAEKAEATHSWRERRVQELEEALRGLLAGGNCLPYDEAEMCCEWCDSPAQYPHKTGCAWLEADSVLANSEWQEQIRKGAKHE